MLKTRSGLPRHCTYQLDRDGKRRVRFRRRGVSVYLTGIPWSEDFMRQYAAALEADQQQRAQVGAARTLPGSFDELFVAYAENHSSAAIIFSPARLPSGLVSCSGSAQSTATGPSRSYSVFTSRGL